MPQALRQDGERHDDARGAGAHPPLTRREVGSVITVLIIYKTFGCQLVNNLLDGRQQCALKEPGVETGDC